MEGEVGTARVCREKGKTVITKTGKSMVFSDQYENVQGIK